MPSFINNFLIYKNIKINKPKINTKKNIIKCGI